MTLRQPPLPFPETEAYADPFIPARANEAALAWLARPHEWPDGRLVLAAGEGYGKTHFAHRAVREGGTLWRVLGDVLDPPPFVVLDDADLSPEASLLHLLNAAAERGGRVLLTMRTVPAQAAIVLPDLASRLRAAALATLDPPDDDLLEAILLSACAARQLAVARPVQDFVRLRLPRTGAAMRAAAAALDRAALASGRTVTRPLAQSVLRALGVDTDDSAEAVRYASPSLFEEAPHEPR